MGVPSAADALNTMQGRRFDVIVSDIAMAGRDGLDLMRTVREMGIDIPSVAVTALSTDEDRQRTADAGFTLHLAKPIDQTTLVGRIAGLLAPRQAPSA